MRVTPRDPAVPAIYSEVTRMGQEWVAIIALDVDRSRDTIEEPVYCKQILTYSVVVVLVGPLLVWAALVLPGW